MRIRTLNYIRKEAIEVSEEIGDTQATPAIIEELEAYLKLREESGREDALGGDGVTEVIQACLSALSKLGGKECLATCIN